MSQCRTGCGRPTDRMLCEQCLWQVERALSELPALLTELTTALTRQTAMGGGGGAKSTKGKTQPLPFDVRSSEVLDQMRIVLHGWVRDIAETYEQDLPVDTLRSMSRWLLARLDIVAVHSAADDIHDEITDAAAAGWQAVDRAAERVLVGVCDYVTPDARQREVIFGEQPTPCGEWLYAKLGSRTITCRGCQSTYDVASSREALWDALGEVLMTIAEIVSWGRQLEYITGGEVKRVRNLLDQWVKRRRITPHSLNRQGRGLYPFGETLSSAMAATRKKVA